MQSALVFTFIISVAFAAVFQLEMIKIRSKKSKMIEDGTWPQFLKRKKFSHSLQKMSIMSHSTPVSDYTDTEFLVNITLGTPPQQFMVIPDTSGSNLWVADSTCQIQLKSNEDVLRTVGTARLTGYSCISVYFGNIPPEIPEIASRLAGSCSRKRRYMLNESTSWSDNHQMKWKIKYNAKSTVSGFLARETVCFGSELTLELVNDAEEFVNGTQEIVNGTQELCVNGALFGRAIVVTGFDTDQADGVFGLAFQSDSLDNTITQNLLDAPIFTVWLSNIDSNAQGSGSGLVTFGSLDTKNCGSKLIYEPLTKTDLWQFKMTGISIGSFSSNFSAQAFSDVGKESILGPKKIVHALAAEVKAEFDEANDVFVIPCDAKPADIAITIGNHQYFITHNNYITQKNSNGQCFFAFGVSKSGNGPDWMLGDPFIHTYCTTYDMGKKQIGFSKSKTTS